MSRHRSPGGAPIAEESSPHDLPQQRQRRISTPPSVIRGRLVVAAVAAGAFAAAGQSMASGEPAPDQDGITPLASGQDAAASFSSATDDSSRGMGGSAPAPEMLPVAKVSSADSEVEKLAKSERISEQRAEEEAARIAAEEEAKRPKIVAPAEGTFTSGFGGRWGTTHYGIDIANSKGTPIVSAADGVVIDAGPASGFGLWVRVQHEDGTITVYGHVNTITASEGEKVKAGDQIATMGNRGFSTGTHLHFEVWNASGKKINPLPWLSARGVDVT
ncbi:M23 family metallopeptidase [Saccharopolyspora sp. 6M]|uniref:M23 family metallopeptidase n=1 Tax=Saccharopolyspora sp. 6M TaxID=2877237 RepID=UPI001CD7D7E1|nr:M23 family metallopeptidase [Saccharopolyspora sp. 6M]MCA1226734.1 M23 family metallopeptidase [Saccharopolyspora sp. 6M]